MKGVRHRVSTQAKNRAVCVVADGFLSTSTLYLGLGILDARGIAQLREMELIEKVGHKTLLTEAATLCKPAHIQRSSILPK